MRLTCMSLFTTIRIETLLANRHPVILLVDAKPDVISFVAGFDVFTIPRVCKGTQNLKVLVLFRLDDSGHMCILLTLHISPNKLFETIGRLLDDNLLSLNMDTVQSNRKEIQKVGCWNDRQISHCVLGYPLPWFILRRPRLGLVRPEHPKSRTLIDCNVNCRRPVITGPVFRQGQNNLSPVLDRLLLIHVYVRPVNMDTRLDQLSNHPRIGQCNQTGLSCRLAHHLTHPYELITSERLFMFIVQIDKESKWISLLLNNVKFFVMQQTINVIRMKSSWIVNRENASVQKNMSHWLF